MQSEGKGKDACCNIVISPSLAECADGALLQRHLRAHAKCGRAVQFPVSWVCTRSLVPYIAVVKFGDLYCIKIDAGTHAKPRAAIWIAQVHFYTWHTWPCHGPQGQEDNDLCVHIESSGPFGRAIWELEEPELE